MKRIRNTIAIVMALVCAVAAAIPASAGNNEASIKFMESVYDFGNVSVKEGKVSHEFTFTNSGDGNLYIKSARADCGCTRPEYSDEPVAPGKNGKVKVTFVPNGKGHFSKKVTIRTNGKPGKTTLLIKGTVVP